MDILDENEFTEVEGRGYLNPQVALNESNTFIDNLRSTQQANNQQIKTDTYNLGTDISSELGGLGGNMDYFTSRYSTPQTSSAVANLRATAQAAALNQALQNEQEIWKKRYQDAYNAYQKRNWNRSNTSGGNNENQSTWEGEPKLKTLDELEETETLYDDTSTSSIPPNPYSDEFNITGEEQTERISERSGLPEWLVNQLKIISNP